MSSNYVEININLTPTQRNMIAKAVKSGSSARLKFTNSQLKGNNAKLYVSKMQYKRIQKALSNNKGVMLTISQKQLNQMKKGGILPLILPALIGAVAPFLLNKLFPGNSNEGSGIMLPYQQQPRPTRQKKIAVNKEQNFEYMGNGINIPMGHGMADESGPIKPANGENTQYHLAGNSSSYLPDSYANSYGYDTSKYRKLKPLAQKNVKRAKGMADIYINPQSEKFQMLK